MNAGAHAVSCHHGHPSTSGGNKEAADEAAAAAALWLALSFDFTTSMVEVPPPLALPQSLLPLLSSPLPLSVQSSLLFLLPSSLPPRVSHRTK
jgi:hypothetical protein